MKSLEEIRNKIDTVDRQIIKFLEQRYILADEVAKLKNSSGLAPTTDASREEEIFRKIDSQMKNRIHLDLTRDLYQHIFSSSKSIRALGRLNTSPFASIGIIGDGLIGRSIHNVIVAKSKSSGVKVTIKNHSWKIDDFLDCELLIIATPIDSVLETAQKIFELRDKLSENLVVIDVASIKNTISQSFAKLNKISKGKVIFVPTHPMGGGQVMGKNAAKSTLFVDRPWVVCSDTDLDISMDLIQKVCDFGKFCGSAPIVIDSKTHDELVTYISHVPGLISKTIHDFVSKKRPEALKLAGSGYEMMTKIGKSNNVRMRNQISNSNKDNIEKVLKEFASELSGKESGIW